MAELYNLASRAYQQGRQRAQEQRLNQLAELAMMKPSQSGPLAAQMMGVDAGAGLELANAIQTRNLADEARARNRAVGLARYLRNIPQANREGVAAVYRQKAPDLPQTLDDQSLDAYMSMAQLGGGGESRVQSRFVGEDGQVYAMMADSPIPIPTGVRAENRQQAFETVDEFGRPIAGVFDPRAGSLGGFGGGMQGGMPPMTAQPPQGRQVQITPTGQAPMPDAATMAQIQDAIARGGDFSIPAPQQRPGLIVGPDPVTQAGSIAAAQAQGRIGAEVALAPQTTAAERDRAGQTEEEKALVTMGTDLLDSLRGSARQASSEVRQLSELENQLSKINTGALATTRIRLGRGAEFLGLSDGSEVSAAEAAASIANRLALSLRNPAGGEGMPGAMSDADREFLVSTIPSIQNTPNGWREMIRIRRVLADAAQDQAREANRFIRAGGRVRDLPLHMQDYADSRRLFEQQRAAPSADNDPLGIRG